MGRSPKPEFLIEYERWLQAGPPRCCHTCEFYGTDGLCVTFFMEPPAEFAETINACAQWVQELPF
jgi:hypothetical protein